MNCGKKVKGSYTMCKNHGLGKGRHKGMQMLFEEEIEPKKHEEDSTGPAKDEDCILEAGAGCYAPRRLPRGKR